MFSTFSTQNSKNISTLFAFDVGKTHPNLARPVLLKRCCSSFVYVFSAILNCVICIIRIKETLRFLTARKSWGMTAFYHMASEIKPGRGLTTKLTTAIPGRLSCLRTPSISSVWIQFAHPPIFMWLMPARFCSLLLLFPAFKFSQILQIYLQAECEPVTLFLRYHNNNTKAKCSLVDCTLSRV